MKNKSPIARSRALLVAGLLALAIPASAQNPSVKVFEQWNTTAGTQHNFQRTVVRSKTISGSVYYYTCGSTLNASGNYDLFLQKKNSSGTVLWTQTYNGAGNKDDYATDLQIDNIGNVYVCGAYYKDATDSNNAIIIKYNTVGTHKWTKTYNGAGSRNDAVAAIQVSANAIIAVGTTWKNTTNMYDFLALRLDSNGTQIWESTWDYGSMIDVAINLWNNGTSVMVAGGAQSASTTYKYAVVRIKFSDGTFVSQTVTGGTAFGIDQVTDIQMDAGGNVYVTGGVLNVSTLYDIKTVKLDTALNQIWSATYSSTGAYNDVGSGLALDQAGNVLVTGYRTDATTGKDYVLIKYSSAGTQRWVASFDGGINADDSATSIVVSPTDTNKIYVSGFSWNGSSKDYWTLKYDGAGNLKWDIGFNNVNNTDDRATSIALDSDGAILVAGQNKINATTHTYTTVKYIEDSVFNPQDTAVAYNNFWFLENRGQLLDSDGDPVPQVRYYNAHTSNPMVYFMDTVVSYVVARADTSLQPDSVCRVDLKYLGQNSGQIEAYNVAEPYMSFFFPHIPDGRSRCQEYENLVFTELYNGIDVVYGSNMLGLKMFYITKPHGGGGNPVGQIDMKFEGADSVRVLPGGELAIYTKLVTLIYPRPAVWQVDASGNRTNLAWQPTYNIVAPNEVKFSSVGIYNSGQYLIFSMDWGYRIPTAFVVNNNVWSTFLQGEGSCEFGHGVTVDASSNSYFTGTTTSYYFPKLAGFQMILSGLQNAYALKFNPQNTLAWGTYIGGTYIDVGTDIKVDGNSNVFVYGFSQSSDYPTTASGSQYIQGNLWGDPTGIISKLDPLGQNLLWSTYFGGDDNDWWEFSGHRMQLDLAGNVFIVGKTNSDQTEGFPIVAHTGSANAYNQANFGGGSTDGFLASFTNNGVIVWSTFIGGNGEDATTSLLWNPNYTTMYMAGYTSSQTPQSICDAPTTGNFPICNSGGFLQGVHGGSVSSDNDAFLMKFNTSMELEWSTYYGGDGQEKEYVEVSGSNQGGIVLIFSTETTTGTPGCGTPSVGDIAVCNSVGTYNTTNAGGVDLFFAMFDPNSDNLTWGTFYGGVGDEYPWQSVAAHDGFCTVGYTKGGGFPTVDPGGAYFYQANNADGSNVTSDPFILTVNGTTVNWATHYGGFYSPVPNCSNDEEWMCGVAYDVFNNTVYAIGGARSMSQAQVSFPYNCGNPQYCWETTPQTTQQNTGVLQDIFVVEFNLYGLVGTNDSLSQPAYDIEVFPNPTDGQMSVILPAGPEFTGYSIMNSLGQVVEHTTLPEDSGRMLNLDLSGYAEGVYILQFESSEGLINKRIVISK